MRNIDYSNCKYISYKLKYGTNLVPITDKYHTNFNDALSETTEYNFTTTQAVVQRCDTVTKDRFIVYTTEPAPQYTKHQGDSEFTYFANKEVKVGDIIKYTYDIPMYLEEAETQRVGGWGAQRYIKTGKYTRNRLRLVSNIDEHIGKNEELKDLYPYENRFNERWNGDITSNHLVVSKIYHDAITFETFKLIGGKFSHHTNLRTKSDGDTDYSRAIKNYSSIGKKVKKYRVTRRANPMLFLR